MQIKIEIIPSCREVVKCDQPTRITKGSGSSSRMALQLEAHLKRKKIVLKM